MSKEHIEKFNIALTEILNSELSKGSFTESVTIWKYWTHNLENCNNIVILMASNDSITGTIK